MERPRHSRPQGGDKEELERTSQRKWSCKISSDSAMVIERRQTGCFLCSMSPTAMMCATRKPWRFSNLSQLWGLHQRRRPPWEEDHMLWRSKNSFLSSIVANQTKSVSSFKFRFCPFHTGSLKPKLFPNYSGYFLLSVGKEQRHPTGC